MQNKLYKIDISQLKAEHRDLPFFGDLENFMDKIALANPLFEFTIDESCIKSQWATGGEINNFFHRAKVFQDGEELGAVETDVRGYGSNKEYVYGVESFRIVKHRGSRNTSHTKDLKVALRLVKKMIQPRADVELTSHIKSNVSLKFKDILGGRENHVRWGVNMHEVAWKYMLNMFYNKKAGHDVVAVRVDNIPGISDIEEHYKRFESFNEALQVNAKLNANEGYGIFTEADGKVVCYDYAKGSVKKYRDFDDLPKVVADKLSVFKLLEVGECFAQYGAKMNDGFYFIVSDEIPSS